MRNKMALSAMLLMAVLPLFAQKPDPPQFSDADKLAMRNAQIETQSLIIQRAQTQDQVRQLDASIQKSQQDLAALYQKMVAKYKIDLKSSVVCDGPQQAYPECADVKAGDLVVKRLPAKEEAKK